MPHQLSSWERTIYICIGIAIGCGLLAMFFVFMLPHHT